MGVGGIIASVASAIHWYETRSGLSGIFASGLGLVTKLTYNMLLAKAEGASRLIGTVVLVNLPQLDLSWFYLNCNALIGDNLVLGQALPAKCM